MTPPPREDINVYPLRGFCTYCLLMPIVERGLGGIFLPNDVAHGGLVVLTPSDLCQTRKCLLGRSGFGYWPHVAPSGDTNVYPRRTRRIIIS